MRTLTNQELNTLAIQNPGLTTKEIKPRVDGENKKFLVTYFDGTEEEIELLPAAVEESDEDDADEITEEFDAFKVDTQEHEGDATIFPPVPPAGTEEPNKDELDDDFTGQSPEELRDSNKSVIKLILEGTLPVEASDSLVLGEDTLEDLIQQVRDENPELQKVIEPEVDANDGTTTDSENDVDANGDTTDNGLDKPVDANVDTTETEVANEESTSVAEDLPKKGKRR